MPSLILDWNLLSDFYGENKEEIILIFNEYLENHASMVNDFEKAAQDGAMVLRNCTHLYAAGFSYIGFPLLTSKCRELESMCESNRDTADILSAYKLLIADIKNSYKLITEAAMQLNSLTAA